MLITANNHVATEYIVFRRVLGVGRKQGVYLCLKHINLLLKSNEELHGGQEGPLTLTYNLTTMDTERLRAKCNTECIIHKFGIPFTLAVVAGGLRYGVENMCLKATAATYRGAELARDLLARRGRVVIETKRALVSHFVL